MYNPMDLSGKQYLVTGASSGVGRQVCVTLSRMGAKVILTARSESGLMETSQLMNGEKQIYYKFDLNEMEKIEKFIEKIVEDNGKLDGLVHCAGLTMTRTLAMTTYGFIQEMMRVNVLSFIESVRILTKKKNCNESGSIVAVSSAGSIRGDKAKTAYCATKGALDSAVQALALELGERKKIRVNTVNPGWIRGKVWENYIEAVGQDKMKEIERRQILGISKPEEVSNVIAFLLSPAASNITGQAIVADGGWTIW